MIGNALVSVINSRVLVSLIKYILARVLRFQAAVSGAALIYLSGSINIIARLNALKNMCGISFGHSLLGGH
jgi:hypothetical protein